MGLISWLGKEAGWDERKIRKASAILDVLYLIGFLIMLYYAISFMGQVHPCLELAKANCSGYFGTNITACCPCNLTVIP
jgi:hypothetical protein